MRRFCPNPTQISPGAVSFPIFWAPRAPGLTINTQLMLWRLPPRQSVEGFSQRGYFGGRSRSNEAEAKVPAEQRNEAKWAHFCDFREITHVVVKDNRVSVHRQDNKCLVSGTFSSGGPQNRRVFRCCLGGKNEDI